MTTKLSLIPEWAPVDAVMLAWPHKKTDWAPWLEETRGTYLEVISAINDSKSGVILLCHPDDVSALQQALPSHAKVLILPAEFNDTWMRDYGFLTCATSDGANQPVEFVFNGWGNKFDAGADNQANKRYLASLCQLPIVSSDIVAEGGALEIDADGHLLSTESCLLNPERNGDMTLAQYEQEFVRMLGAKKVTVLSHGHLEGDDTDGHVDTLVRFTPDKGLVIQAADNRLDDSHFAGLNALCEECAALMPDHQQFHLPLPLMYNEDGERLPASYANYLICNQSVLVPVYGQPEDDEALAIVASAYPQHKIVPVNCATLVRQFGSLHCISMQVPSNTLKESVINAMNKGVSIHAKDNA